MKRQFRNNMPGMRKRMQESKRPRVRNTATKKKKDEITQLGQALRALGGVGGGALGSYLGNPALGASAGTGLGAIVSKWLGQGDYSVRSNTLIAGVKADGQIPAMHKDGQTIVVRHKEYLGELTSSTTFAVKKRLSINPGDSGTFPWLSAVAAQYSEYRLRGMVYHYVPTSGYAVSTTNPALGSVMFQTSYRANEPAASTKIEMMNEYWSSEGRPCDEFCHPIECDPKENPFNVQYVRTGPLSATDNILLYDLGTTTIATTGMPASGNVVGDIWVTYEIELKKPKLTNLNTESARSLALIAQDGTATSGNPLGVAGTNGFVTTIAGANFQGGNQVVVPVNTPGYWLCVWTLSNATSLATAAFSFYNATVIASSTVSSVGTTSAVVASVIKQTDSTLPTGITCSVSISGAATISAFRMTEYNSSFGF